MVENLDDRLGIFSPFLILNVTSATPSPFSSRNMRPAFSRARRGTHFKNPPVLSPSKIYRSATYAAGLSSASPAFVSAARTSGISRMLKGFAFGGALTTAFGFFMRHSIDVRKHTAYAHCYA